MLGPDPSNDTPDVILGPDDLTIGGHGPDNILGSLAHEALLLEGVARARLPGAECDQTEQGIIIAPMATQMSLVRGAAIPPPPPPP